MERRVVITGLGAICPVGNTVADFWESLKAGKSGLNFIQGYDDVDLPVRIVAQVKDFDPIANGLERADVRKMDLYCQYLSQPEATQTPLGSSSVHWTSNSPFLVSSTVMSALVRSAETA